MLLSAKRTNTRHAVCLGAAAVRAALMLRSCLLRAQRSWNQCSQNNCAGLQGYGYRSMKPQRSPAISSSSARRALSTTWVSTWAMGKWSMRPVRASRSQTSTPAEPGLSVGAESAAPRRAALLPLHRQARKAAAQDLLLPLANRVHPPMAAAQKNDSPWTLCLSVRTGTATAPTRCCRAENLSLTTSPAAGHRTQSASKDLRFRFLRSSGRPARARHGKLHA